MCSRCLLWPKIPHFTSYFILHFLASHLLVERSEQLSPFISSWWESIYLKNRIIVYQFELLHAANKLRPASKHSDWRGEIRAGEPGCPGGSPLQLRARDLGMEIRLLWDSFQVTNVTNVTPHVITTGSQNWQIKYSPTSKRNLTVNLYF